MTMYQKKPDRIYRDPDTGRTMQHQGHATRIYWNTTMLDYLRRNFARTLNDELAEWLGVSQRTVLRKARELGLQKDAEWLSAVWDQRRRMAHMVARSRGYPGGFKKGQRAHPDGEFKTGHKLTEEETAKRSASMKQWYRQHPAEAREKARKAWETRRQKNSVPPCLCGE